MLGNPLILPGAGMTESIRTYTGTQSCHWHFPNLKNLAWIDVCKQCLCTLAQGWQLGTSTHHAPMSYIYIFRSVYLRLILGFDYVKIWLMDYNLRVLCVNDAGTTILGHTYIWWTLSIGMNLPMGAYIRRCYDCPGTGITGTYKSDTWSWCRDK